MQHPTLSAAMALILWQSTVVAQSTLLVGPGGYPQIQDAITAASPGDLILVQPGNYGFFGCQKGVTLRATVPGMALAGGLLPNHAIIPAGQTMQIVGMRLAGLMAGGRVTLDACVFDVMNGFLSLTNATATLQSCVITPATPPFLGGQTAVTASNSEVTAIDCIIRGYAGVPVQNTQPSLGIELLNSRLRASHLTVAGGLGLGVATVPAIRADAASRLWISDSTITADPAACAIVATNGRSDRCTISPNCSGVGTGFVLGVHQPQPLQNGNPFTLEFRAQPGMPIGVWIGDRIAATSLPLFEQSLLLAPQTAFPAATLVADGNGLATGTWTVPAGTTLVDQAAWFQAFAGLGTPLQASPLAGGIVR